MFVCFTAFVSLTPLGMMTFVNFSQYQRTLTAEMIQPISHLASNSRRFLEDFLGERRAALIYVANRESYQELCDPTHLGEIFRNMKNSFGGFVDLGVIDSNGNQRSYVGPHTWRARTTANRIGTTKPSSKASTSAMSSWVIATFPTS